MTIDDLMTLARSRLIHLTAIREQAVRTGDSAALSAIETEMAETESTLNALEAL